MPEVTTTPSVPKFLLYPSFQKTAARILGGLNSKKNLLPKGERWRANTESYEIHLGGRPCCYWMHADWIDVADSTQNSISKGSGKYKYIKFKMSFKNASKD